MRTRAALAAVLSIGVLTACGGASEDGPPVLSDVDSALVDVLADVHLADARAELFGDSAGVAAESLRAVALAAHGLDAAAFAHRLSEVTADPRRAVAVYDAVTQRLSRETFGSPDESADAPQPLSP